MTINARLVLVALYTLTVAACDGGGGGDSSPDAFQFIDQTGVAPVSILISNSITVTGIDTDTDISVSGGEYSVDDEPFTTMDGIIGLNQTVAVRQTSSIEFATTTDTILTIGGVTDTFSVTTRSETIDDGEEMPFICLLKTFSALAPSMNEERCLRRRRDELALRAVAHTAQVTNPILSLGGGVSINDHGEIAFTGRRLDRTRGVFLESLPGQNAAVVSALDADFGEFAQINNRSQVAFRAAHLDGLTTFVNRFHPDNSTDAEIIAQAGTRVTSPFFALESTFSLNNEGRVLFYGALNNTPPGPTVLATPILINDAGQERIESFFRSSDVGSGEIFPALADTGTSVAHLNRGSAGQLLEFTGSSLSSALLIADENEFVDLGERPGISDDGIAIAFMGAHREEGVGIWLDLIDIRVKVAGLSGDGIIDPGEIVNDSNGNGRVDLGEDAGTLRALSLQPKVAVNRLHPNSTEAYRVAYLAWSSNENLLGLYVTDVDARDPFAPIAGPPQRILELGGSVVGVPGQIADIDLFDAVNNHGHLAFWVRTTANAPIDTEALGQAGRFSELGRCHDGVRAKVCAVVTTGRFPQVTSVWSDQFEGVLANAIVGAAGQASIPGRWGNSVFMATRADHRAYVRAEVPNPTQGLLLRLLDPTREGEDAIENGPGNELVGMEARMVSRSLTFSSPRSYRVVAGTDNNSNGDLERDEITEYVDGWVRVITPLYYTAQRAAIAQGLALGIGSPLASMMLETFFRGTPPDFSDVAETTTRVVCDTAPPLDRCAETPCRCHPIIPGVAPETFSLDHHVGMTFTSTGPSPEATISHYQIPASNRLASAVLASTVLRRWIRDVVREKHTQLLAGQAVPLPALANFECADTDLCNEADEDIRLVYGSYALLDATIEAVIDESIADPTILSLRVVGTLSDLYDFRFPTIEGFDSAAPRAAATIQIGYGTLTSQERSGRVFTHRVHLDGMIDLAELRN